ncbi:MAG TPA: tetratricopeptide repeat protein [Pirellulales bacterium]|nr:tetratricopeptide repeat protein [Pirellulales bacterium]
MLSAATVTNAGAAERRTGRREGRWRRAIWMLALVTVFGVIAGKFLAPRAFVAYDLYQARRAMALVHPTEALSWLQAAERREPDRAEVQFLLGAVYRRSGAFRPARQHLERALALGYSRKEVERQDWMMLFQMGHVSEVEPLLTKLLERGVSDELAEDVYEAMVIGYLSDHRVREAGVFSDYWIGWRPDSLRARLMRAYMYEGVFNLEKLQSELGEVLRIDPRRVTQRLRLVKMLLDQKQVNEALAECEICREHAPGDPRVSVRLGICHYQLGRLDEAKRELESALAASLEPSSRLEALMILGQIASAAHDFELARRCCQEALELRPYDGTAAYGLGLALSKLGQNELARQYLESSKRLMEQGQRLAEIDQELIKNAADVGLRLEMARIMLDQGRRPDAAAWMQTVLRYDPKCREAHELLAEFYEEHAKPELAQAHREALADMAASESAGAVGGTEAAGGTGNP